MYPRCLLKTILEQPASVIEGVVNRSVHIQVRRPLVGRTPRYELGSRHHQIDHHAVLLALFVVRVGSLHGDVAARDAVMKGFELHGTPTNVVFDGG